MNRPQADAVIAALMAHYPGVTLSEANQNAYATALMPLPPKQAMRAALEVARREEHFPSVAALLRAIGEALSDAPTAAEAWEEVRASFANHYCYPMYCDYGGWEPSHPLIQRTVEALDYHRLMARANPAADQAQFKARYEEYRIEAARSAAAGKLPAPATVKTLPVGDPANAQKLEELRAGTAKALEA